jgi:hypothetical protein
VYWPTLVPADTVSHRVVLPDGSERVVPHGDPAPFAPPTPGPADPRTAGPVTVPAGPTRRAPLGLVCAARSGDKGGNANIGLWTRDRASYAWLSAYLTEDRLRELLPEAADLAVRRWELPNLNALNLVVVGILGSGVASSPRPDPQAKGLGEYLRSRHVDIPVALLDER